MTFDGFSNILILDPFLIIDYSVVYYGIDWEEVKDYSCVQRRQWQGVYSCGNGAQTGCHRCICADSKN